MSVSPLSIGRGWSVVTADGKRIGDVIEVHPHYLLVSRGVILVRDMYLPLGTVDHTENNSVILTVTHETLRLMDLSHVPPVPEPEAAETSSEIEAPGYVPNAYDSDTTTVANPTDYTSTWPTFEDNQYNTDFDETPSFTRPTQNGLVEVEPGLNLTYQDLGYGSAIVLVQGWPFDSTVWEPLTTTLANDFRVITYDPRGIGNSDRPWDYYSIELFSHDLHRLIVEQSLRDVTIVGWSSGALLALIYAREHRTRVTRLVLLNPLLPAWLTDAALLEKLGIEPELNAATQDAWTAELRDDRPAFHERLLSTLTYTPLSRPRSQWLWQRLMQGAHHAQLKHWESLRTYDLSYVLPEVQHQVTIICSEQDRLSPPAISHHLASQLTNAEVRILSECGHASFLDQHDEISKIITDLVSILYPGYALEAGEDYADMTSDVDTDGESEEAMSEDSSQTETGEVLPVESAEPIAPSIDPAGE